MGIPDRSLGRMGPFCTTDLQRREAGYQGREKVFVFV